VAALWSYNLEALIAPPPIGLGVFTEGVTIGWCGIGTARVCPCRESDSKSAETGRYRGVYRHV
jgi:hypothetical protein